MKKTLKKLQLSRETVRQMNSDDVVVYAVRGGVYSTRPGECGTLRPCTSQISCTRNW